MTPGDRAAVRVMIVDDDERMRFLLRSVLEEIGCEVAAEASSGPDAIKAFDDAEPDVVLVDYVMPGMDGIETAEGLRERRPEQPIIIFSSLFDRRLAGEVESRGLYYLEKARGLDGLEQAIKEITSDAGDSPDDGETAGDPAGPKARRRDHSDRPTPPDS